MDHITANKRRAATLLALVTVAVALVVWAVLAVAGLPLAGLVIGLVCGAGAGYAVYATGESMALSAAGAAPADATAHARLHNLVEGLCIAAGVPKPALAVVEDGAPNALTVGRSPRTATLVVTTGLLASLSRIELEGVLAHELAHVKHLDILPSTVAVPVARLAPKLAGRVLPPNAEALADVTGVSFTRYPPGLISALEKLRDGGAAAPSASKAIAHLWIEPGPSRAGAPPARTLMPTHPPLDERIEALREL